MTFSTLQNFKPNLTSQFGLAGFLQPDLAATKVLTTVQKPADGTSTPKHPAQRDALVLTMMLGSAGATSLRRAPQSRLGQGASSWILTAGTSPRYLDIPAVRL